VAAIIFTGTDRIKTVIVNSCQVLPAAGIFPYPALERFFDGFLLLLGNSGFLFVQNTLFYTVLINRIKNPYILLLTFIGTFCELSLYV